jgi:hypothetical protein
MALRLASLAALFAAAAAGGGVAAPTAAPAAAGNATAGATYSAANVADFQVRLARAFAATDCERERACRGDAHVGARARAVRGGRVCEAELFAAVAAGGRIAGGGGLVFPLSRSPASTRRA